MAAYPRIHGTAFPIESLTLEQDFFTVRTTLDITTDSLKNPQDVSQSSLDKLVEVIGTRAQPVILGGVVVTSETSPADLPAYTQGGAVAVATMNAGVITSVAVLQAGTGFTAVPTVSFIDAGSGATATATLGVVSATLAAAGSGYAVGDKVTLTGGTTTQAAVMLVTAVNGSGGITATTPFTPGLYTALPSNPVAQGSTTGAGTSATFTVKWGLSSVVVTAGGAGYVAPAVVLAAGAISGAIPVYTVKFSTEHVAAWTPSALAAALNGIGGFVSTSPTTANNVAVTVSQTL